MELILTSPEVLLNFSPLITTSPLSLLVVTLYFSSEISLTPFPIPVIFIPPKPTSTFDPDWGLSTNSTKFRAISLGKSIRFLLTLQILRRLPKLHFTWDEPDEATVWKWSFESHPNVLWEPYLSRNFKIYPQYVILLLALEKTWVFDWEPLEFDSQAFGNISSFADASKLPYDLEIGMLDFQYTSLFESFLTDAKPAVFLLYFNKDGRELYTQQRRDTSEPILIREASAAHATPRGYQRALFAGFMLNWFCGLQVWSWRYERYNYNFWWFSCPVDTVTSSNSSCWDVAFDAMNAACDDGREAAWTVHYKLANGEQTPVRSDKSMSLAPAWKQPELASALMEVLFPELEIDPEYGRCYLKYCDPIPEFDKLHFDFTKVIRKTAEPVVFVTTEEVVSERSGFEVYMGIFDGFTWISLLVSMVICATVFSVRMSPKGTSLRSRYFLNTLAKLMFSLIDQFPNSEFGIRTLSGTWLLSLLILSNWYKGEVKSSFAIRFPYKTSLDNWRDFENFSLFGLTNSNLKCQSGELGTRETIDDIVPYIRWEVAENGPLPAVAKLNIDPVTHLSYTLNTGPGSEFISSNGVYTWLQDNLAAAKACVKHAKNTTSERDQQRCRQDLQIFQNLNRRLDMVYLEEFRDYVGASYREKVFEAREIGAMPVEHWNLTYFNLYGYEFNTSGVEYISTESSRLLYWMSRKYKSAFVFAQSEFPYYWNLFKQLMNETKLRFAHTEVSIPKDELGNFIPQMASLPDIGFQGPPHAYPPPAKWMLDRMRALTTSGLTRWYQKWNLILRPPRKYRRSEEVPEGTIGAKPVAIGDAAFVTTLWIWIVGVWTSVGFAVMELLNAICV